MSGMVGGGAGAGRGGARRTSIADVARLAGVSQGTVSNVLNHPDRVTAATRERVEDAIARLEFVPHGPARSLAAGAMRALGLILSDLTNSLFVDVSRGVERVAAEHGAFVLIANSDTDLARERQYLANFEATQALATLVTINDASHYRTLVAQHRTARPLVFLNYHGVSDAHCTVDMGNREGGRLAARHLIGLGRRRLLVVGGPLELQPVADRVAGFTEEARAAGLDVMYDHVDELHRAQGWALGRRIAPRVLAGEVDGVFAVADLVAAGIAQALSATPGLTIPRDVGIVGYDDNRAAWDSPTPLTTIRQPGEELGATGARIAFEEITDPTHVHRSITLDPALVVRGSTVEAAGAGPV
ncbi:LacI family DNA-binding transcriptional regulator [Demequina sp. SYSU T00192]|uniref:LacI family DNA-binding transcriptional regulator n=1 Tax=Demequina litoralis TaxID=3051660 RepID=A0ABT8G6V3_9MICO|nr:LacI family DNA-binding transcriptional regulator [Demequina sp. SYSU T00192]MDN4474727.1 LacI family DNA-binding transcriptional regulator [Demequina sp. SYSU T00192]